MDKNKNKFSRRKAVATTLLGATGLFLANQGCTPDILPETDASEPIGELKAPEPYSEPQFENVSISKTNITNDKVSFARSNENETEWNEIKKLIWANSKFTDNNELHENFSDNYSNIEVDFIFKKKPLDSEFSIFHIEPLIDQASDLMERAINGRKEWDELSVKYFELSLELFEYFDLDEIHNEEEQAGLYDIAWKQSSSLVDASTAIMHTNNELLNNHFDDTIFLNNSFNKSNYAAQLSGWLSGLSPYRIGSQKVKKWNAYTWRNEKKRFYDHAMNAAFVQAEHAKLLFMSNWQLQIPSINHSTIITAARLNGQTEQKAWDELNANFQRRRTMVARNYQDIKSKASTQADGILNYKKRLDPLKESFQKDFRDALARLKVVEKGLKLIYGYSFPLPSEVNNLSYFDDCLIWTREVIQWLIKLSRNELNTVYPISIKSFYSRNDWKDALKSGFLKINLNNDFFGKMKLARLRGFSVYFKDRTSKDNTILQLLVQPPKKSVIRQLNGAINYVDQSEFSPCVLGRVAQRNSYRNADVIGSSSLFNISPLGDWEISILDQISLKRIDKIKDIIIEFHLSYHWKELKI